jgi:hypothetical protein
MGHKKYRLETNCLNCGSEVTGKFCSSCGQENIDTHENFFHVVWHFITDYLHFDSKFFRSLASLFVKPGFLTRQYWDGKRLQYIHPLRLFFFITILFMVSTSYFYSHYGEEFKHNIIKTDNVYAQLDSAHLASLPESERITLPGTSRTMTVKQAKENKVAEQVQVKRMQTGFDFVFRNLKYITFFLLPVYALVFALLFIRMKGYYVDHLVYAMHLQSFAYILMGLVLLLPVFFAVSAGLMQAIAFAGILFYVTASLHFLYRQRWWKTILKSVLATSVLFFITVLSVLAVAIVNAIYFQH